MTMTESINPELNFTLDDAVAEVLGMLEGMDLPFVPEYDRYRTITRQLNRALRSNALEKEWSYYSSTASLGPVMSGATTVDLPNTLRPRVTRDDAVRLVDEHDVVRVWAYFLPRESLHKYGDRGESLWAAVRRGTVMFSRPFYSHEVGWDIQIPVMREPTMFRLPPQPEDENEPMEVVPDDVRQQPIDFSYPDVVTLRAAFYYAQTDPVMQPRVQTLEAQYKDLMYQMIERDDRNTDAPFLNEFILPVTSSLSGLSSPSSHGHPHSDARG